MPRIGDPKAWFLKATKVSEDPTTSAWVKNALVDAISRNPVEAAKDAKILSGILQLRAAAAQRKLIIPDTPNKAVKTNS